MSGTSAMDEYRAQARALMMWAGMLRFRMSSETYSQFDEARCLYSLMKMR